MIDEARADGALDGARRAFLEHVEELRMQFYHAVLQAAIRHVSPVALAFADHLEMSMDDILQAMAPPAFWPPASGALLRPRARWDLSFQNGRWGRAVSADRLCRRVLRTGGFVHRLAGGGDFVGWTVVGDTVESLVLLGDVAAITRRGTLRLRLPGGLPETIIAALPGRPLRSLVDHPVLATGDWMIAAVQDCAGGGHVVRVRTGQSPFAAPPPASLARMITHGGASVAAPHVRET